MSKYTRGKETRNNIVMCYEGISPYWFKLWAKAALLTGRQNVLRGQYFTHLACSLYHCEGVFFWAVYNNTCALYFPQINGNARVGGGASKMDATGRLTYRLPNRDKKESRPAGPNWKRGQPCFQSARFHRTHLLCLIAPQIYTVVPRSGRKKWWRFSLNQTVQILCLIERDKWKVGEVARGFLEATFTAGSREAVASGPHRWPRIWIRSAVPSDNRPS